MFLKSLEINYLIMFWVHNVDAGSCNYETWDTGCDIYANNVEDTMVSVDTRRYNVLGKCG